MDFRKRVPKSFGAVESLDTKKAREQIDALRDAVHYHDRKYYVENAPVISDSAYDRLFHRLEDLEKAFPQFDSETSPTRRVGAAPVSKLAKHRHTTTMLSLNSSLEKSDIENFDSFIRKNTGTSEKRRYIVEPKWDGLSVEIVYENGAFSRGSTRGDGVTGEDITDNLKTIRALPLQLERNSGYPDFLSLRGEILLSRKGFLNVNKRKVEEGQAPLANPRNAAAGLMRQLDSKKVAGMPLDIFFYEILGSSEDGFVEHWEALGAIKKWGCKVSEPRRICASIEDIESYRERLLNKRDELDFEIDGVVIKLNDRFARENVGTRQRSPRWAFAWKFPAKKEVSMVRDIAVSVGRTGKLTPVGLLDPVEIGGVTVSRATLHNEHEVHRKDVRAGDKVRLMRAGDVIPEIIERIPEKGKKRAKPFSMPSRCPSCNSPVIREGAYYLCTAGLACPGQLVGRISHYAARNAMDIENLGEKNVRQLVERGMVKDVADLYELSVEDLQSLEHFGHKSARKLHSAIENAKHRSLNRFIYGMGIPGVGEHLARILAEHFGSVDELEDAGYTELRQVAELGEETARSVHSFFAQKHNRDVLGRLKKIGVKPKKQQRTRKSSRLEGKTLVVTGELESLSRNEATERIEEAGGHATSSVSGQTDYVVVGENPGGKFDEAKKRGVKTIDEGQFRELVEDT